ncbi:MAG: regulatory protein RecX [Anaerolineaceae bacterium]
MVDREITGIQAQKRNPERVNIYLDGEFAFGLSRIVAAWLHQGQRLSEEKIAVLCNEDGDEVAYQKALLLLNRQQRTSQEIRQKLTIKGFSSSQIDEVLLKLERAGLVEDERFAKLWVENRNSFHPRSRRLIRLELLHKGIAEEDITNALEGSAEDTELATQAAMQQVRKFSTLEWELFRKKLSAFLLRRGFSYGTVASVVRSVWESVNDHEKQN